VIVEQAHAADPWGSRVCARLAFQAEVEAGG